VLSSKSLADNVKVSPSSTTIFSKLSKVIDVKSRLPPVVKVSVPKPASKVSIPLVELRINSSSPEPVVIISTFETESVALPSDIVSGLLPSIVTVKLVELPV